MNFPQVLNALSMASPLLIWARKRRFHKHLAFHKLLILHIPISFMYHFLQGISGIIPMSQKIIIMLKVADCAMIHGYTTICNVGIATYNKMKFSRWEALTRCSSYIINISCIVNMIREPRVIDDVVFSMMRVSAIGVLSWSTVRHTDQSIQGTVYGVSCALLFMSDSKLANYGHCLFHLLLGCLHHTIYKCVERKRELSIPMLPLLCN